MLTPIYLDYNATTPLRLPVRERMLEVMELPLNPSSMHTYGRQAKKLLEDARKTLADALSVWSREIIFTASGTEANNLALKGLPDRPLVISTIEHSSISKCHPGEGRDPGPPAFTGVTSDGVINLQELEAILQSIAMPALVSIMLANNETGVIQPIAEIADIVHRHGGLLHTDAVQAFGKIPMDAGLLNADLLTISAHKCGGPVGAAALIIRGDLPLKPLLNGGGQELGRRAGTENIAAITGFAKAVELFDFNQIQQLRSWLDAMEQCLTDATVFSRHVPRLPNTSCISMPGVSSEVQLMNFDLSGFMISAGSACSSGRIEPSHVLRAMGTEDKTAGSAIRVSLGWNTKEKEIQKFTEEWQRLYARLGQKNKKSSAL